MNILMLCDFFEPIKLIGAVRPTDFAYCLKEMGHEVEIVTLDYSIWPKDNVKYGFNVTYISVDNSKYFAPYRRAIKFKNILKRKNGENQIAKSKNRSNSTNDKESLGGRIKKKISTNFDTNLNILFGKCGAKAFISFCKKNIKKYDVLYTTYGGFSSPLAGCVLKEKAGKKMQWIVDFRDGVFNEMFTKSRKMFHKNFVSKYCRKSDSLIFASKGYLDNSFVSKKYKGKISIIENGFIAYKTSPNIKHDNLTFLYVGTIYGDRHFTTFFKALSNLKLKHESLKIKVEFCGDDVSFSRFYAEAKQYNVENFIVYLGFLMSDDLIKKELSVDSFLISSWNYKGYSDVIPGKLFEYFSFVKPIIGHISGNKPNALVKKMINENGLGFCGDDLSDTDERKMEDYISSMYNSFLDNGFVIFQGNREYTDLFLRRKQVEKLLTTIETKKY